MSDIRVKSKNEWKDALGTRDGRVLIAGKLITSSVKKNLEANGSAHAAGDVLSETDTASAGTAWHFKNVVPYEGGSGYIVKARAETQVESQTYRIALQLYTRNPSGAELDDNAAAASPTPADAPYFLDEILLPDLHSRGDNSYSVATPSTSGNLPLSFTCEGQSRDLWVVAIAVTATTHTATEYLKLELSIAPCE